MEPEAEAELVLPLLLVVVILSSNSNIFLEVSAVDVHHLWMVEDRPELYDGRGVGYQQVWARGRGRGIGALGVAIDVAVGFAPSFAVSLVVVAVVVPVHGGGGVRWVGSRGRGGVPWVFDKALSRRDLAAGEKEGREGDAEVVEAAEGEVATAAKEHVEAVKLLLLLL